GWRAPAAAEEGREGKAAAAASSVRDKLEAMRESLAARGGADPAAWAAAVLTLLDAILRAAPRALRAGLERLRAHLALVASGTAPDPAGALATIERELGELVALLDGRPRRRGAFWRCGDRHGQRADRRSGRTTRRCLVSQERRREREMRAPVAWCASCLRGARCRSGSRPSSRSVPSPRSAARR